MSAISLEEKALVFFTFITFLEVWKPIEQKTLSNLGTLLTFQSSFVVLSQTFDHWIIKKNFFVIFPDSIRNKWICVLQIHLISTKKIISLSTYLHILRKRIVAIVVFLSPHSFIRFLVKIVVHYFSTVLLRHCEFAKCVEFQKPSQNYIFLHFWIRIQNSKTAKYVILLEERKKMTTSQSSDELVCCIMRNFLSHIYFLVLRII